MHNFSQFEQSIHQRLEALWRHQATLLVAITLLTLAIVYSDVHFGKIMQKIANPGFGWINMYTRQEHPTHERLGVTISKTPSISGNL